MKIILNFILSTSLLILLSACGNSSTNRYIPQAEDSIPNDKNNMGLKGKVKTMDIYYFYPQPVKSLFEPKFKKGKKWEYKGNQHIQIIFNKDGSFSQQTQYDIDGNLIYKIDYIYGNWGYTRIDSTMNDGKYDLQSIVRKYDKNGNLLELNENYGTAGVEGEVNTYDDNGNIVRKEMITQIDSHAFALTKYDYNEKKLLTEKREYYNKIILYRKYIYTYNEKNLLSDEKSYNYYINYLNGTDPILENHYIYSYDDSCRLSAEYKVEGNNKPELISTYNYQYYPSGKLKAVLRDGNYLLEEYDEQGRLIDRDVTPGFDIIREDSLNYTYDKCDNWITIKEFEDFMEVSNPLMYIIKPLVERHFNYYE